MAAKKQTATKTSAPRAKKTTAAAVVSSAFTVGQAVATVLDEGHKHHNSRGIVRKANSDGTFDVRLNRPKNRVEVRTFNADQLRAL